MAQEQGLDDRIALTAEKIRAGKTSLGIEFGSTRIKAVLIDDTYTTIAAGDYGWASHLEDGLWSYSQEEIWTGLQTAYAALAEDVENAYGEKLTRVGRIGFSAMMHGYLAFGKDGELLVPFRTWQNTNTSEAHEKLSELFQYNIPERWSGRAQQRRAHRQGRFLHHPRRLRALEAHRQEGARRWRRIRHVPDRSYHAHLRNRIH